MYLNPYYYKIYLYFYGIYLHSCDNTYTIVSPIKSGNLESTAVYDNTDLILILEFSFLIQIIKQMIFLYIYNK